jgi:hypothetical protein
LKVKFQFPAALRLASGSNSQSPSHRKLPS